MQPTKAIARTVTMTLDDVIERLTRHASIDGIMLLGTTGTDALTSTSDYDLLLVMNELPAPLRMVNTWMDGRLTEIYFTTVAALERVVEDGATWRDGSEEGTVLVWLKEGRVVLDRSGRLEAATAKARVASPPILAGEREMHEAWRKIGYNVTQVRRYLTADDPVAKTVIDMRLLYSVAEVNLHYFTVRQLPWRGEKSAIRHWAEHDPGYLSCLHRLFEENDRRRKVEMYEELADLALDPLGGAWKRGETVVSIGAGYGSGEIASSVGADRDALELWRDLINAPDGGTR